MKADAPGTNPPRERFLTRWSRLKRKGGSTDDAAAASPQPHAVGAAAPAAIAEASSAAAAPAEIAATLPPVESLSIESDFAPFFQPKVPEALRRAAVKRLFADPRFNVMDGLDVYIDDYTKPDPIPPEMLQQLAHARDLIDHPSDRIVRENAEGAVPPPDDSDVDTREPAHAASTEQESMAPRSELERSESRSEPQLPAERAAGGSEPHDAAPPSIPADRPAEAG